MRWIYLSVIALLILIGLFFLIGARQTPIQESFTTAPSDTPPTSTQLDSLESDQDYQTFYAWHKQFCDTWTKVITQSMKVDQTTLSQAEYIQKLQTTQNKTFVQCNPAITPNPDPVAIVTLVPDKPDTYLATLNYMAQRISTILTDTEKALRGEAPTVQEDGFANPPQTCAIPCPPDVIAARTKALEEVRAKVKRFNPSIQTLKGQLQIVETGLRDLEAYKQRAESGEIIKDINISAE
jgi:hypothetical protein